MRDAYRQGDVLLLTGATIPKGAKKSTNMILASGETGHPHVAEGAVAMLEHDGRRFLRVAKAGARIVHRREEGHQHRGVELPQGIYEIRIQREYEPEGWREVRD